MLYSTLVFHILMLTLPVGVSRQCENAFLFWLTPRAGKRCTEWAVYLERLLFFAFVFEKPRGYGCPMWYRT